jgi:DNA-directed RNA polymerase specialized sigma24 family protein
MTEDPITVWITGLKAGDAAAAEGLWHRYFPNMVALARRKLAGSPAGASDEEDMALSAFDSLCRGAAQGRFPKLADRHCLWPLLALITARKVYDAVHWEHRQKRGGGAVQAESELAGQDGRQFALDEVMAPEPTPQAVAAMNEQCGRLLETLPPPERQVVRYKLEGYTNNEIAQMLQVTPRTVERKLDLVRRTWTEVLRDESSDA